MASIVWYDDGGEAYAMHAPCYEDGRDAQAMELLHENENDKEELTGFRCPKCKQVVDLVLRGKPA